MPAKLKANGDVVATLSNDKLHAVNEKGGKQGHKARMELIRRGQLDGQGKTVFDVVAESA